MLILNLSCRKNLQGIGWWQKDPSMWSEWSGHTLPPVTSVNCVMEIETFMKACVCDRWLICICSCEGVKDWTVGVLVGLMTDD